MEFVKKVRVKGRPQLAGTQSLDRTWGAIKQHVPKGIHALQGHAVNPKLLQHARSYAWRGNRLREGADLFRELGSLFRV